MANVRDIVGALGSRVIWSPLPTTIADLQRRYAEIILSDDDGSDWGSIERLLLVNFGTLGSAHVTRDMLALFADELDTKQRETSGLGSLMRGWAV